MSGLGLLAAKELRELVRTRRFAVVVIVFALVGLLSPVTARYLREIVEALAGDELIGLIPEPTAADAVAQLTKNIGQFGTLLAILVTMGTVATEKERGTAALVLTKPVSRGAFLVAKVAAIGLLLAVAMTVAAVLAWIYTAILFEPLPPAGFAAAMVLVWLSLAAFAAITFLASVLTRSALAAGGLALGALLVSGFLSALPGLGAWLPTGLWGAADLLAVGTVPDPLLGPVVANVLLVAGAIGLAWASFRGQEL